MSASVTISEIKTNNICWRDLEKLNAYKGIHQLSTVRQSDVLVIMLIGLGIFNSRTDKLEILIVFNKFRKWVGNSRDSNYAINAKSKSLWWQYMPQPPGPKHTSTFFKLFPAKFSQQLRVVKISVKCGALETFSNYQLFRFNEWGRSDLNIISCWLWADSVLLIF